MNAQQFYDYFSQGRQYSVGKCGLDHYREVAAEAAYDLSECGYTHIRFEPGDFTRYDITITHRESDNNFIIALPEFGTAYLLPSFGGLVPEYVTEKWKLRGGSAAVFALLMQCIDEARQEVGV